MNRVRFAIIERGGGAAGAGGDVAGERMPTITIEEPKVLDTKWDYRAFVAPKAGGDTDGSW